MNSSIRHLLDQIGTLESELRTALHEQESRISFEIKGRRIEFEETIRDTHRRLKVGLVRWLLGVRPQNFLCAPFIYGMIVPLVFLMFASRSTRRSVSRFSGLPGPGARIIWCSTGGSSNT